MFITAHPIFGWNPSHAQVLESQDFANHPPGTILRDFAALLELMEPKGLPATPKHLFALGTLETINQRLTHPIALRSKRPLQKSYPNINGLYLVLRATGIPMIDIQGKKPFLVLDPEMMATWNSLNATEAYFSLLRAWWGEADESIIDSQSWHDSFTRSTLFLRHLKEQGPNWLKRPRVIKSLSYSPSLHNLALLEMFGLVEVALAKPTESPGWQPKAVNITPWGDALMAHFEHFLDRLGPLDSETAEPEPEPEPDPETKPDLEAGDLFLPSERFDAWARSLRLVFTDWKRDLEIPDPPFQPGRHVLRAALARDCWRSIAIDGEASFDTLASAILAAFDFDEDHLYAFRFTDRIGRQAEIAHPYLAGETDGELADDVQIGELNMHKGVTMVFVFDFGANWKFDLTVEQVDDEPSATAPQVLEAQGEAPPQYDNTW